MQWLAVVGALMLPILGGCDTLYGVRVTLLAPDQEPLADACIVSGIHSAGLHVDDHDKSQLHIYDKSGKNLLFSLSKATPGKPALYFWGMHDPVPCEIIKTVVPQMRAAARGIQRECSSAGREIALQEKWTQSSCGL